MSAQIIDGKAVADSIEAEVAQAVKHRLSTGKPAPGLEVILCGDDPASHTYVRSKERACVRVGIRSKVHRLPETVSTAEVIQLLEKLNRDPSVNAILVQLPLPMEVDSDAVLETMAQDKDVDGFHPANFGRLAQGQKVVAPCTPTGCMELLRHYEIPISGANAVIVGRSVIVGRPLAALLTNADATVTLCHSKTKDLTDVCREADILVAAIGKPAMIDNPYVKPGACVIDIGINRLDGKLVGDVDRRSVEPVAGWLTPVPRGVGPMTIAMLLSNTMTLTEKQAE